MNLRNSDFENSDTIRATLLLPDGQIQQLGTPVVMPNVNRSINARSQWAITSNNTLNFNAEYQRNDNRNQGVGGFNLAERASVRKTRNSEIQLRETAILTKSLVHETRFEFRTDRNNQSPITSAVAVRIRLR